MTLTYQRVDTPATERRTYTIVLGTVPGYSDGQALPAIRAVHAAREWRAARIRAGKPFLTGNFVPGHLSYGYLGTHGDPVDVIEPSLTFTGEASVLYHADLGDSTITDMLDELADAMGNALEQTRVYVTYRWMAYVRQAEGHSTPRDATDPATAPPRPVIVAGTGL